MLKRLTSKTPKLVKKLQKIAGAISSLAVVIASLSNVYEIFEIKDWMIYTIIVATVINHFLLELFTESDNI